MGKNVIYVDFIFKHKKVTHFNYYITFAFFFLLTNFKLLIRRNYKNNDILPQIKDSNKYINL
jgi:hypothetical protein